MTRSRDDSIDFLKGGLILFVVYGHSIQYIIYGGKEEVFKDAIFTFIYIFHMPLFMILSGYFAGPEKLIQKEILGLVAEKTTQILCPMLLWVSFILASRVLIEVAEGNPSPFPSIAFFGRSVLNDYWFLWSVFLAYALRRLLCNIPIPAAGMEIIGSLSLILFPFQDVPILGPMLYMFSFMFPFFCLGSGIKYLRAQKSRFTRTLILAISLFFFGASYLAWTPKVYSYINRVDFFSFPKEVTLMFLGGVSGSILVAIFGLSLHARIKKTKLSQYFTRLGKVTLQIYLAQTFIFEIIAHLHITMLKDIPYLPCLAASLAATLLITEACAQLARIPLPDRLNALLWGGRRLQFASR